MRALELKVPPVAVALIIAALLWFVSWAAPTFRFVFPGRGVLALILAGAGVVMAALGVASFRRAKTTVHPMTPELSSSLVRSGVYALSRNPMYLGLLLVLIGWAIFLSNVLAFLILPVFIFYMSRFQIGPEEKALDRRFGEEFVTYKSRVRRWL
jgi:protein-S-isoprenylcysteine O-methyltransferase Ste14